MLSQCCWYSTNRFFFWGSSPPYCGAFHPCRSGRVRNEICFATVVESMIKSTKSSTATQQCFCVSLPPLPLPPPTIPDTTNYQKLAVLAVLTGLVGLVTPSSIYSTASARESEEGGRATGNQRARTLTNSSPSPQPHTSSVRFGDHPQHAACIYLPACLCLSDLLRIAAATRHSTRWDTTMSQSASCWSCWQHLTYVTRSLGRSVARSVTLGHSYWKVQQICRFSCFFL